MSSFNPFYANTAPKSSVVTPPLPKPSSSGFTSAPVTKTTASSKMQSPPERLDPNQILTNLANFNQETADNTGGIVSVQNGIGLFDTVGRAPAYFMERPAATAQIIARRGSQFLGGGKEIDTGIPGGVAKVGADLLGGVGDVLQNVANILPTAVNAGIADQLTRMKDMPDDTPLTGGFDLFNFMPFVGPTLSQLAKETGFSPKTIGDLRKQNALKGDGGFTAQDLEDIKAGKTTVFDYAHKALNDSAIVDMIYRIGLDPTTAATFLVPPLGLGAKAAMFARLAKAGVELEKPLIAAKAAEAVVAGVSRDVTMAGIAHYAGSVARSTAKTALSKPAVYRPLELGAKAVGLNTKVGIGLGLAEAGIEQVSTMVGPQSGFIEPLFELNHAVMTNRPWSDNVQFMMISGLNFHYGARIKEITGKIKEARVSKLGDPVPNQMLEFLAPGKNAKEAMAHVSKYMGGEDRFYQFIDHLQMRIAYDKIAPRLKEMSGHWYSADEAAYKSGLIHEMVSQKVASMRARGEFKASDMRAAAQDWYGYRSQGGQVINNVRFPWNPEMAMGQWQRYAEVATPIGKVLRDRATGMAGEYNVPMPVVALADVLPREGLQNARITMESWAVDGMVPNSVIMDQLSRMPQLIEGNTKEANYFKQFLADPKLDGNFKQIERNLRKREARAPTIRELFTPQERAEQEALRAGMETDPVRPPVANAVEEPAPITIRASTFKAGEYGVAKTVTDAVRSGLTPAAARVRNNLVDGLQRMGIDAQQARAVLVGGSKQSGLETVLKSSSIEEMRTAATLIGRTTGSPYVDLVVTGERLTHFALKPNGFEVVYQLPNADPAALQGVSAILKQHFTDFTVNADTGFVRITTRDIPGSDLIKLLDGEVKNGIGLHYPTDAAGFDGISRSTNPAYIERIGRSKSSNDLQYRRVASDNAADPRWSAESALRNWVGSPTGPAADVSGGAASELGLAGSAVDPLRLSPVYREQWAKAGASPHEIDALSALIEARAKVLGVPADKLHENVNVFATDTAPTDATFNQLVKDIAEVMPEDARMALLTQDAPKWLVEEGGNHAAASPLVPYAFDTAVTKHGNTVYIPGGLEGEWSVWDAMRVRAQMINTADLYAANPDFTEALYAKMFRSQVRDLADPMETFRVVTFALTSPRTDFILNEARSLAAKLSTPEELAAFADRYELKAGVVDRGKRIGTPYKVGSPDSVRELGRQVAKDLGLKGEVKGLDEHFGNIVLAAKLFREHQELFTLQPGQDLNQFAERLMNLTRGAGLKVGTFGPMLANPIMGTRGTIDTWMVKFLNKFVADHGPMLEAEEVARGLPKGYLTKSFPPNSIPQARRVVITSPDVPAYLKELEPYLTADSKGVKHVQIFEGSAYERANAILRIDQELSGTGRSFDLGGHQWLRWDIERGGRLEPHVAVYPGTYAMSKGAVIGGKAGGRPSLMDVVAELKKAGFSSKTKPIPGYVPNPALMLGQEVGTNIAGYTIIDQAKTVIGLTTHKNASTALHEAWHGILEPTLTEAERAVLTKHGAIGETGARYFERYLYDGFSPVAELDAIFAKVKQMMTDVYTRLKGSAIEKDLHPEVRATFDQMFGGTGVPNVAPADLVGHFNIMERSPLGRWFRYASKDNVYHVTPAENLPLIAEGGLKASTPDVGVPGRGAWNEGGTGKRVWYSKSGFAARNATPAKGEMAILRIKEADAGTLRAAPGEVPGSALYSQRAVPAGMIEVLGKDEKWYSLRTYFDRPLGEPPADLTPAAATVEAITKDVNPANLTDTITSAAKFESDLSAATRDIKTQIVPEATLMEQLRNTVDANGTILPGMEAESQRLNLAIERARAGVNAAVRSERDLPGYDYAGNAGPAAYSQAVPIDPLQAAIDLAIRDAKFANQGPALKLHGAWSEADGEVARVIDAWDARIRAEFPGYQIKPQPKVAWVDDFKNNPVIGNLRLREGVAQWLTASSPLSPAFRLMDWLLTPEPNARLGAAAKSTLMSELVAKGARPQDVEQFMVAARNKVDAIKLTENLRLFTDPSHAPTWLINEAARESFSPEVLARIGEGNFYKLIDRAGNRFIRSQIETRRSGGNVGRLAHALETFYYAGQATPGVQQLRYLKVMYHTFRFLMDPRWHAMNKFEADILGGTNYGALRHGADRTIEGNAYKVHVGGTKFEERTGASTGWFYPRHLEGVISRSFNKAVANTEQQVLRDIDASQWGEFRRMFPDANSTDDIAKVLNDQLYNFDTKGVAKTGEEILTADQTQFARDMQAEELAPLLQKLYEANQREFDTIVNTFEGNHSRTNLERIGNSYFLYWPLSYQLKAAKWVWDVATKKIAGNESGALGAATYTQVWDAHKKAMQSDPEYAQQFADHPSLWFLAQQLIPILPGDMGVSLSRPVRYGVGLALNVLDPNRMEDGSPLGYWGNYKKAQDPLHLALGVTEMGPIFTYQSAAQAINEVLGQRSFTINVPQGGASAAPTSFGGIGAAPANPNVLPIK